MPHTVFVSYSSKDAHVANAVCEHLEQAGIPCWIAPRDVLPGSKYGAVLLEAIEESKLLVIVLSSHSNESPQVELEVERAVSKGMLVVPFRIDQAPLSKSLEYFLSASHWIDASTGPIEQHLAKLTSTIPILLQPGSQNFLRMAKGRTPGGSTRGGLINRRNTGLFIGAMILVVAAIVIYVRSHGDVPQNSVALLTEASSSNGRYPGSFDQEVFSQLKKHGSARTILYEAQQGASISEVKQLAGETGCRFLLVLSRAQEEDSNTVDVALYDTGITPDAKIWTSRSHVVERTLHAEARRVAECVDQCIHIELSPLHTRIRPDVFSAYREGNLQLLRGDEEGLLHALTSFQSATDLDSMFAEGYVALANAQLQYYEICIERNITGRKNWRTLAEANANRALLLDSTQAGAYTVVGRIADDQGDKNAAVEIFKKALRLNPEDATTLCLLGRIYVQDLGQPEEALRCFSLAKQQNPENTTTAMNCIVAYLALQNYPQAIQALKEIAIKDPDDADVWKNMGNVYDKMDMFDSAMSAYRCAIDRSPSSIDTYEYFAGSALACRRIASADSVLSGAVRSYPGSYTLLYHHGLVKLLMGRTDEAKHAFRQGLEMARNDLAHDSRRPESILLVALFKARLGETRESLHLARQAYDLDTANGSTALGMAEVHAANGDRAGLLRWFARAKEKAPLDFDASFVKTNLDFAAYSSDGELLAIARR
jgi:tetratricopeptide (TPR) repeat protein